MRIIFLYGNIQKLSERKETAGEEYLYFLARDADIDCLFTKSISRYARAFLGGAKRVAWEFFRKTNNMQNFFF